MKNLYEIRGAITAIFLNSPKYGSMETLISTIHLERVLQFENTWYPKYEKRTKSFYVVGNKTIALNKRRIYGMHQWIVELFKGFEIDHIDHDTLNNTDDNLRKLKPMENKQNKKGARSDSTSGIRNVLWSSTLKKWKVELKIAGKKMYFGSYDDMKEAELVAIEARKKHMPYSVEVQG